MVDLVSRDELRQHSSLQIFNVKADEKCLTSIKEIAIPLRNKY